MGDKSGIEWTDATWNPVVGCSVVSPGCTNCYAMKMAARLETMTPKPDGRGNLGLIHYEGTAEWSRAGAVWTGKVALAPDAILLAPLRWRRPRRIFVNSMGDLFHESVPDEWIDKVFAVMALAPQHTFQLLTKRARRMREYLTARHTPRDVYELVCDLTIEGRLQVALIPPGGDENLAPPAPRIFLDRWPLPNVWLGVSAEDQARADERIPDLLATPAAVRFVSAEPLLGSIDLRAICDDSLDDLCGDRPALDWVIAGGESGPNARPMHPDWTRKLRDQCEGASVPFFFKQHGKWIGVPDLRRLPGGSGPGFGAFDHCRYDQEAEAVRVGERAAGRLLDGREHNDMPKAIA